MAKSSTKRSQARKRDKFRRKAKLERKQERSPSVEEKITPYLAHSVVSKIRQRFDGLEIEEIIWILETYGWPALSFKKGGKKYWLPDTIHHKTPRSRGGDNKKENFKHLPEKIHVAWHRLFENLIPQKEIIPVLEHIGRGFFIRNNPIKRKAWKLIFGQRTIEECIEHIKEEWI